MDTLLLVLDEDLNIPSSRANWSGKPSASAKIPEFTPPFEENDSLLGGLGGEAPEVSVNSEDSDAGIHVSRVPLPSLVGRHMLTKSAVTFFSSGIYCRVRGNIVGCGGVKSYHPGPQNEVKHLKEGNKYWDDALGTVLRSLLMEIIDHL